MDKISSVVPSSKRVTAVDMSEAPPVRPGAPAFGRAEGSSAIKDKITRSSLAKTNDLGGLQTYKNPKEAARSKIAEDITNKFFAKKTVNVEKPQAIEESPSLAEELLTNGYERDYRAEEPILDVEI